MSAQNDNEAINLTFDSNTHTTYSQGSFSIKFPKNVGEGDLIVFNIYHDTNPNDYKYNFNFGDGTRVNNSNGIESHKYKGQGNPNSVGRTGRNIVISIFKDGTPIDRFEKYVLYL